MKYSIIIPTYNKLEECLKPCLESVIEHTDGIGETVEIIVVSNGCTDGTVEYVTNRGVDGVKLLSFPEPLGYTKAVNTGLGVAQGDYVVLLNNDCVILDFAGKNEWLDMLHDPFTDPNVGITGPSKLFSKEMQNYFMVFFCVMIPRSLFFEIGYLDETFNPGGGEDIDFCMRLEQAGYRQVKVPEDNNEWSYETKFPLYHQGEATVHDENLMPDWEDKFQKRMKLIAMRAERGYYSNFADVTCEISTKGRYHSTLPLAIMSVIQQELKPKKLIIFQDDFNPQVDQPAHMRDERNDMTKMDVYKHLLTMCDKVGIEWVVMFGTGEGQVRNHQKALEMAETEWIWRLDDDNFAEPDTLRLLMEETGPGIAAVAPSCVDPQQVTTPNWSTKIEHINTHSNVQWIGKGYPSLLPAEHLYSTFVYRKSMADHGYDMNLSEVGHREETIFTYQMHKAGHRLLVNRDAMVWHLREGSGGIRSHRDHTKWERDEAHFRRLCDGWGVDIKQRLWVNLDGGRGDHYMFRMALPEIKKAHPDKLITVACAYPECMDGESGIELRSVQDGILGCGNFNDLNVYKWCMERNWDKSLVDAFKEIYK